MDEEKAKKDRKLILKLFANSGFAHGEHVEIKKGNQKKTLQPYKPQGHGKSTKATQRTCHINAVTCGLG